MNNDELVNGISNIDDDIIAITAISRKKRSRRPLIIKAVAMAACICLILTAVIFLPKDPKIGNDPSHLIKPLTTVAVEAKYPEMPQYPGEDLAMENWNEYELARNEWRDYTKKVCGYPTQKQLHAVDEFVKNTAAEFLKDNDGENVLYSPINVYFALSMLAETAAGESREQILDLLGSDSIEDLRRAASVIWQANYRDDGVVKSVFANSLWLNDQLSYKNDTLNILKDNYYASSYSGKMGSEEYDAAFRGWINKQTGGLLEEAVEQLPGMTPDVILKMVSTVYYKAPWEQEFYKAFNTTEVFHSPGGDKQCEFMNQGTTGTYYSGENFAAVGKRMQNYGNMFFLLPDEGVSVDELMQSGEALEFITAKKADYNQVTGITINFKVPKFDVTSSLKLSDMLPKLGVRDVFGSKADLSNITDEFAYVSSIDHSARVKINEEGCEAAAFTVISDAGGSMPRDEVDFFLDRPFIFVIASSIDTPLFIGIVNNP